MTRYDHTAADALRKAADVAEIIRDLFKQSPRFTDPARAGRYTKVQTGDLRK